MQDFLKKLKKQSVFKKNYLMQILFRCTRRKFAEDFQNGKIYFSTPGAWIEMEEKFGKGRGDLLEGTYAGVCEKEGEIIANGIEEDPNKPDIEYCKAEGFVHFRRKGIRNCYCLCFYGITDESYVIEDVDEYGIKHHKLKVEKEYFVDFSDDVTMDNYDSLPKEEQPVVLMIYNPSHLFYRIKCALKKLGVKENEIIIYPVEYIDKHCLYMADLVYPLELLVKDKYFSRQNELRIIINSKSKRFKEYMKSHNSVIDIGNIESFAKISEYYFKDLFIEKLYDGNIVIELPTPREESIYDMSLYDLMLFTFTIASDTPPYKIKYEGTKEYGMEVLKKILKEKFDVDIEYKDNKLLVDTSNEEVKKAMDVWNSQGLMERQYDKFINEYIIKNGNEKARKLLDDYIQKGIMVKESIYYSGIIDMNQKKYKEAVQTFTYCINMKILIDKALWYRSVAYLNLDEYKLAINDLNEFQDMKGYNKAIYINKGIAYLRLDRYKDAISSFNKAIEIDTDNANLYYCRAEAFFKMGEYQKSREDLEHAIQINPNDESYKENIGLLIKYIDNQNNA